METINYFYEVDSDGNTISDEDGNPVVRNRGQVANMATLSKMVEEGRPQKAIDIYCELVAKGENWRAYDSYREKRDKYESDLAQYESYLSLYEAAEDKDSLVAPVEPSELSFTPQTDDTIKGRLEPVLKVKRKKEREAEFSNITVEHNGFVYDADKEARSAITEAITTLQGKGVDTIQWKLADNTWEEISLSDLIEVSYLAGMKVVEIMQKY